MTLLVEIHQNFCFLLGQGSFTMNAAHTAPASLMFSGCQSVHPLPFIGQEYLGSWRPAPSQNLRLLALSCRDSCSLGPQRGLARQPGALHLLLLTAPPTSLLSILECQGLPIVNGQCDPYATVTLAGPYRQVSVPNTCYSLQAWRVVRSRLE